MQKLTLPITLILFLSALPLLYGMEEEGEVFKALLRDPRNLVPAHVVLENYNQEDNEIEQRIEELRKEKKELVDKLRIACANNEREAQIERANRKTMQLFATIAYGIVGISCVFLGLTLYKSWKNKEVEKRKEPQLT